MSDIVEMKAVKVGKKMDLDVLERMTLLGVLPREGNFINLKLVRLVREELSFTEEENRALQFRNVIQAGVPMIHWNTVVVRNKATGEIVKDSTEVIAQMMATDPDAFETSAACPPKEFVFGETVVGLIVKSLQELDKAEKITQEHYSLYEKFMEGHEENSGK